jgi:hypothetical protein
LQDAPEAVWRTHWRTGAKSPANRTFLGGLEIARGSVGPLRGSGSPAPSLRWPKREEIDAPVDEKLIFEHYSR